jgi:CheY-like chemotaxis protein
MKRPKLLLCVDDDPDIRGFYQAAFANSGYEVLVAGDGRQALSIFQSLNKRIDAVITDYEMPGMNGPELSAALKHSKPNLPILMVSGSQPVLEEAPHFVDAALNKGAPLQTILDKIEHLLSENRPPARWSRHALLASALAVAANTTLVCSRMWK